MEREILLGYLINALETDEIVGVERELLRDPSLRTELDRLKKELLPLDVVSREEFLPPFGLTERTCARIWASVDQASGHFVDRNLSTITLNRFRILDEILEAGPQILEPGPEILEPGPVVPESPGSQIPAPIACKRSLPKITGDMRPGVSEGGWRLVDLVASVVVGILIAVIAFPAINFAKQQTERMVKQSRMKEFGQNVGLFALIDGKPVDDDMRPNSVNLATSAWQKVTPDRFPLLPIGYGTPDGSQLFKTVSDRSPHIGEHHGRTILLGPETALDFGASYSPLLVDVEKAISVSNGSLVQPAYGQNVLFQDGHIYFRVLPIFQSADD